MSNSYEQFGKYLLLEKVAAGGMAEIYLAKSAAANGLNKFVAIKRILPQFTNNEDFVSMFKEEAKVCINLNHSNVVSIYDFGIEASQFFLVMDFVEGRNLRQIINELKKTNKSFSIDQALYLVKEAAAGLDHAHRCVDSTNGKPLNITHRDMSPQNVMVSFEGEVKVIDFGIAKAETEAEDTKAGTLKGKFSYMSPEQAEGQPIDPRTDVFALGIVLWELLANDRLFTGSNEAAILRKVRDCQVPQIRKINPTVPQELERIVMKALAKDKNVRYQTAANFHRDLNRFLNTQYPDFSPQDFSAFVKESFKASYQEAREKLVAYANVAMQTTYNPLFPNVDTAITQANAIPKMGVVAIPPKPEKQTPAEKPASPVDKAASSENEPPQAPFGFNADKLNKVNLDDLRSAANGQNKNFPSYYQKNQNNNQTRVTQVSQVSYNRNGKKSDTGDIVFKLAFLSVLVFGGWWGYKNFYLPSLVKKTSVIAVKPGTDVPNKINAGTEVQSSIAATKVSVTSDPEKAMILVDGKDSGFLTPAVITVPTNTDVEITVRSKGYLDYSIKKKFDQPTGQFAATLQVFVETAYLNINLSSSDSFTKITINGSEVLGKAPILKYPIIADRETIVKAYNPFTKLSDEIVLKVKPGVVEDIELVLGRTKTK
jgi:serine/threonine protein kinase